MTNLRNLLVKAIAHREFLADQISAINQERGTDYPIPDLPADLANWLNDNFDPIESYMEKIVYSLDTFLPFDSEDDYE